MATKTIGVSGADYGTMTLWSAYMNVLTISAPEVGAVLSGGEVPDTLPVLINVAGGNSATNTITLRPETGQGFGDHANKLTNPRRYDASLGAALTSSSGVFTTGYRFDDTYTTVIGMMMTSTVASTYLLQMAIAGGNQFLRNTILDGLVNTYLINSFELFFENVLAINRSANSSGGIIFSQTVTNSTNIVAVATNGATGIGAAASYSSGRIIKNAAVAGFTTDYGGTVSASSVNNATDKSSFGGTNWGGTGQTSLVATDEWEDVGNTTPDFRLKSTSAKLKANGATGSSADIVGTAWNASKDIGVSAFAAAANRPVKMAGRWGGYAGANGGFAG